MTKSSKKLHMWVWLLALPLFQLGSGVVFAQEQPAAAQSQSMSASQAAAQVDTSTLTGTDACLHCHKEASEQVSKSIHTGTYDTGRNAHGTSNSGCDGCHGSSKAHADAELLAEKNDTKDPEAKKLIFRFDASPKENDAHCLTCHASGPTHLNSANSFHRQNDVSCIDCHSPHQAATKEKLLAKAQPGLCYSCHLQQKSQFNMPFRHRVNEGLIKCTDCHNQHGTEGVWESGDLIRQVRTSDSGDTVCFKCHKDKQGPFVWAHASVKVAGCAACHIPHGGANLHMLKYSNVNLLCLSCHTAAAFGHGPNGTSPQTGFPVMDAQNSTQQQACPLCHVQVHGSNSSNLLFR
jgi:DmsE family decaheme c-type cytochrome